MPDMEKVIKGLECCHNKNMLWQHDQCPYHGFDEDCKANLHADALAMLKEQEEKIEHLNNVTLGYEKEVFRLQDLAVKYERLLEEMLSYQQ